MAPELLLTEIYQKFHFLLLYLPSTTLQEIEEKKHTKEIAKGFNGKKIIIEAYITDVYEDKIECVLEGENNGTYTIEGHYGKRKGGTKWKEFIFKFSLYYTAGLRTKVLSLKKHKIRAHGVISWVSVSRCENSRYETGIDEYVYSGRSDPPVPIWSDPVIPEV